MTFSDRLPDIINSIKLPFGWELHARHDARGFAYIQVGDSAARDNVTGEATAWRGRKWLLSEHMTDGEVVQTAFLAVMTAVEHEAREVFTYQGRAIFDPHYDIYKLVELRARPDALRERD
jgi:hypothetical protein